jgi:hypothetical protein
LNLTLLQQIFDWTKVSRRALSLKAAHDQTPPQGLYLTFPYCANYGFIHLGKVLKGAYSKFDIIPAEIGPASASARDIDLDEPKYALSITSNCLSLAFQNKWLHWDAQLGYITLADKLCPSCFVDICKDEDSPSQFRLKTTDYRNSSKQLNMGRERIPPGDLILGLTTAQISFTEPTLDDVDSEVALFATIITNSD